VVFYGVNDLAEIASISLKTMNIELVGVVDDSKDRKKFLDFPVRSPEELRDMEFDRIIVTVLELKEPIIKRLLTINVPREKIITL